MGDIAEMMLDGTLCEGCGVYLEGGGQGFPRYCGGCGPSRQHRPARRPRLDRPRPSQPLSPKLFKLLDEVRMFSEPGGGMCAGMRIDQMTRRMNQLVRFGWAVVETPHNPVHKGRLVITEAGRAVLTERGNRHA